MAAPRRRGGFPVFVDGHRRSCGSRLEKLPGRPPDTSEPMIWLYPPAAIALLALAVPIVVHVLIRQRATRIAFPTLRFIRPHRLASVRRRALDDVALLTIRLAIF